MQELDDIELLRRYARDGSDEAFGQIVRRHVNLVYSAALRKTSDPAAAEEITQVVFIILARNVDRMSSRTTLSGWLYQTTRLTALGFLKKAHRRAQREHEAYMQTLEPETQAWAQIAPLLEDAVGSLNEKDRNVVVLRYFEGRSFHEVGAAVGTSENGAKKRIGR